MVFARSPDTSRVSGSYVDPTKEIPKNLALITGMPSRQRFKKSFCFCWTFAVSCRTKHQPPPLPTPGLLPCTDDDIPYRKLIFPLVRMRFLLPSVPPPPVGYPFVQAIQMHFEDLQHPCICDINPIHPLSACIPQHSTAPSLSRGLRCVTTVSVGIPFHLRQYKCLPCPSCVNCFSIS